LRYLLILALLGSTLVHAQPVNRVEYYFDTDPGFGNGTAMPITPAVDITQNFTIPLSTLSEGFHLLYVRAKSNGLWSLPVAKSVFVQRGAQTATVLFINRVEYFFDSDPGLGNGITIPITAGMDVSQNLTLPLSTIPNGFHILYFRARTTDGRWSIPVAKTVFVQQNTQTSVTPLLKQIEYFIDTDPGLGNGTRVSLSASTVDQLITIDLSASTNGFHILYVRSQDNNGLWSLPAAKPFFAGSSGSDIVALEYYYFDGTTKSTLRNYTGFTPAKNLTIDFAAVLDGLLPSTSYEIHITAISENGQRSSEVVHTFLTPPVICDPLTAPATTGSSICGGGSATLTATGATGSQTYQWYAATTGGISISGDSTFTTPAINVTTTFYVAIQNGTCESLRTAVVAQVDPLPLPPVTTSASSCGPSTVITLSATGGSNGQYRWYSVATGGTAMAGEVNSTFTTPLLSTTTSYYVTINNGTCESLRTPAIATIIICTPNQPPNIETSTVTTYVAGIATIDLSTLISDPDNNLDLTSLQIITQPVSGALASITNNILRVNYAGITFVGTDILFIEICDLSGDCAQQSFTIEVEGDIIIYNGISPNSDDKNSIFLIENIELLPETQKNIVSIYNRWGDLIFEIENYNNVDRVFKGLNQNGNELPSGTYFYKIEFENRSTVTGYLALKR
jgi:gliding motility-associated-like protein